MLLSMTGFGEGRGQNDHLVITTEIRSVNNRQLKISVRCPDAFLTLEHDLEKLVRTRVRRGTVYVNLYVDRLDRGHDQSIDTAVLAHYWNQLVEVSRELQTSPPPDLSSLLALPGVVVDWRHHLLEEDDWPLIEQTANEALDALQTFRRHEGEAMAAELESLTKVIERDLHQVAERLPGVVTGYRDKMLGRVRELLSGTSAEIEDRDIVREVSIFADRADVTEEITRLRCHLGQFRIHLTSEESPGRKLDFLCQEMFREINTIGSKANDIEISHAVLNMKNCVEKMREIVQNIE